MAACESPTGAESWPKRDFAAAKDHAGSSACSGASSTQKLALYGLYKQVTKGDCVGSRPGMFDAVGRAKYDAWAGYQVSQRLPGAPRSD